MRSPTLAPVIALVLWSMVMWVWLYATRIPAIRKAHKFGFFYKKYDLLSLNPNPHALSWLSRNSRTLGATQNPDNSLIKL
jgi:hypothetical protein